MGFRKIQNSFSAGELAPSLEGRTDLAKYGAGARRLRNFLVHPHGGISNRPGLRFVGEITAAYDARMIPFQYNVEQSYILVFTCNTAPGAGDSRISFLTDGAFVLQDPGDGTDIVKAAAYKWTASAHGTGEYYLEALAGGDPGLARPESIYEDVGGAGQQALDPGIIGSLAVAEWAWGDNDTLGFDTVYVRLSDSTDPDGKADGWLEAAYRYTVTAPYRAGELYAVKYAQSADQLFLTHPSYKPRVLTRNGAADWTLSELTLTPGIAAPINLDYTSGLSGTGATLAYSVGAVSGSGEESLPSVEASFAWDGTWASGVVVSLAWNELITSTYKWTASAHGTGEYYLEALAGGDPGLSEVGNVWEAGTLLTSGTFGSLAAGEWAWGDNDTLGFSTVYVRLSDSTDPDTKTALGYLTCGFVDDLEWNVYKNVNGFFGWVGAVQKPYFQDTFITPDSSFGPRREKTLFAAAGDYPAAVAFHEQRLFLAASNNQPQTVWASQSGAFTNFTTSSPLQDSDSIAATLASNEVNAVRHLVPLGDLHLFTAGGEWKLSPGSNSDALTPTSLQFRQQGRRGSSQVAPIVAGDSVLFVQRGGDIVRDYAYSLDKDGYTGTDLTVLANHLFRGREITAWAWQQRPDSVLWCVRDDGYLLGLTYLKEQEIWAWHLHDTNGSFADVCGLPGDDADEVYFIVEREVDGAGKVFIEMFSNRVNPEDDIEDSFFVDSGLSYDGRVSVTSAYQWTTSGSGTDEYYLEISGGGDPGLLEPSRVESEGEILPGGTLGSLAAGEWAWGDNDTLGFNTVYIRLSTTPGLTGGVEVWQGVSSVTGLDHLEGEEVSIFGDGSVYPAQTVSGGALTISPPASVVHAGLAYTALMETLPVDIESKWGSTQGLPKQIARAVFRVENSRGMWVGPSDAALYEVPWRTDEAYGEPTRPFTGDKDVELFSDWGTAGVVVVTQPDPAPLTILAVILDVEVGEK